MVLAIKLLILVLALSLGGCGMGDKRKLENLASLPPPQILAPLIGDGPLPNHMSGANCRGYVDTLEQSFTKLSATVAEQEQYTALKHIDDWLLALDNTASMVGLYEYVHPDKAIREASLRCSQRLNSLLSNFILSEQIYQALDGMDDSVLDSNTARYREHMLREFKRSGVNLDSAKRERVRELREEILKAGQQYALNIRESRLTTKASLKELDGLPDDYIDTRRLGRSRSITISTDYPDYQPVMQYAHSDALRLRMLKLFLQRARDDNYNALQTLLQKRHQLATLLGYQNYAEYAVEYQMVKSPEAIQRFIDDIDALAFDRSQHDYQVLLDALRETEPRAREVGRWQEFYLSNNVKKSQFALDPKEVRNYFRYQRVKRGIFQLAQDLFGVRIEPREDIPTWHEDVEAYNLYDGDELVGQFYLDMHPRADKYQHAAHFGIRTGVLGRQLASASLVCNFPTDPSHPDGAYMEHRQVETFLHEFGHLLHSMLGSRHYWSSMSGIATEHDFVEAPSQMLEEWIWDEKTLQSFARNDAGEPIPSSLVEKMNQARDFGRGLWVRNQMYYAALALHYYTETPQKIDLEEDMIRLQNRYSPFSYVEDTYFYASFGHLYGYAASYYTYMWSLVIATDLFAEFEKYGLRNPKISHKYKETILKPGGTEDAAVLVRNFLGREYNNEAFANTLRATNAPVE